MSLWQARPCDACAEGLEPCAVEPESHPALRATVHMERSTALTVPEAEWLAFPHGGPALTAVVADDADAPAEHRPDRPGVAGTGDQPQQGHDGQIGRRVGVEPPAGGGGRRS